MKINANIWIEKVWYIVILNMGRVFFNITNDVLDYLFFFYSFLGAKPDESLTITIYIF